jgi:hypothetical protein
MCYWKQWRHTRTKIGHLLAPAVSERMAILTGISRKIYWHLSRSKASQAGMKNNWLEAQDSVRSRGLWIKAHGYERELRVRPVHEPPSADPPAGWCGEDRLGAGTYPISRHF